MREIVLSNGGVTLVDDDDYELFKKYTWRKCSKGYAITLSVGLLLHRLITKCPTGLEVDHKDHNPLNNQKENLRICTKSQNRFNRYKTNKKKTSIYKGVSWSKCAHKWAVTVKINQKQKHLGYFDNEIDAAKLYNRAAIEHYKEYALLNEV